MSDSEIPMRFKIEVDEEFTPWGEPEVIEEETRKIAAGEWAAYNVTAMARDVPDARATLGGCVVGTTETGTFDSLDGIKDEYLRSVAAENVAEVRDLYPAARVKRLAEVREELADSQGEIERLSALLERLEGRGQ